MESLNIDTGVKRICVNGDETRVITFNPSDILFAEKFYRLLGEFQVKQAEYQSKAQELDRLAPTDPKKISLGIAFLREVCEWMRSQIDGLFGAGTSEKAFGEALSLEMFEQFFQGMIPFIKAAREERVARYLTEKNGGRVMQ